MSFQPQLDRFEARCGSKINASIAPAYVSSVHTSIETVLRRPVTHRHTERHNGQVKEPIRHTIIRRTDEPKLEIGETITIKEAVTGVVLARYVPSNPECNEVHYIVEVTAGEKEKM